MKHPVLVRTLTAGTVAALVAAIGATSAPAEEAATLSLGSVGTLTLPANDGVRDSSQLTITASQATTVAVAVRYTSGDQIVALDPVEITDPLVSANVAIDVTGLPAGNLEVTATPAGGETYVQPFTVGSGEARSVSLDLTNSLLYTHSTMTPRSTTATVTASDETELAVPFTGSVKATVGGKTYTVAVASTTGAPASASIAASKVGYGNGSVTATVTGAGDVTTSSEPSALSVRQLSITSVSVATSSSSVYPYKDYFYDSVKITVTPKTSAGVNFASTGSVKITRDGKTVKSWTLTSNKTFVATWDGRVSGNIVPGTYKITATIKGKEGTTQTYSKLVYVKGHKLVTKTKTVKYKASSVLKSYIPLDYYQDGKCYYDNYILGDFGCEGFDAYDVEDLSLLADGKFAIPSDVRAAQKYGKTYTKVSMYVSWKYGDVAWSYDNVEYGDRKIGSLGTKTTTLGSLQNATGASTVYVTVGLGEYSEFIADTITVTYTYKALVS